MDIFRLDTYCFFFFTQQATGHYWLEVNFFSVAVGALTKDNGRMANDMERVLNQEVDGFIGENGLKVSKDGMALDSRLLPVLDTKALGLMDYKMDMV